MQAHTLAPESPEAHAVPTLVWVDGPELSPENPDPQAVPIPGIYTQPVLLQT